MKVYTSKLIKKRFKREGFTLIELLTVIAIVGILAAILIPSIGKVRERAKETSKLSNYRQYFIANTMYASDNDGFSVVVTDKRPPIYRTTPYLTGAGGAPHWTWLLAPYMGVTTANQYLTWLDKVWINPYFEDYDVGKRWLIGTGINMYIRLPQWHKNGWWTGDIPGGENDIGGPTLLSAVTFPEHRFFIGDTQTEWHISNKREINTTQHDGKGMFVLFDGSVVFYDQEEAELSWLDPFELRGR